ncbi:MAG: DUF423 domain-containing protein [Pseudomonadota bacterium]
MLSPRGLLLAGSLCSLCAVILGAWGAHGLEAYLGQDDTSAWETAVQYQFFHGLTLLLLGVWLQGNPHLSRSVGLIGWLLILGVLLFSGSIYGLTLGWGSWLGPITPLGGSCFIIAWGGLCYCAWRTPAHRA